MAFSKVNETEEIHSLKIINGDFCNTGEQRWDYELAHAFEVEFSKKMMRKRILELCQFVLTWIIMTGKAQTCENGGNISLGTKVRVQLFYNQFHILKFSYKMVKKRTGGFLT